jgi:pyridoxal phosphate enzyme (YggS family)
VVEELASRLAAVRGRLEAAEQRAGRPSGTVSLMAVTKGFPRETVQDALAAGLTLFGENRVQEAEEKYAELAQGRCELHLIGHLQRNKARAASVIFDCVQSIDKVDTAEALNTRCVERGRKMDILLELNTSGEATKSGFLAPDDLLRGLEAIARLPALKVRGLMTVGPLTEDQRRIRTAFASLRFVFDRVCAAGRLPGFDVLSMGMSGDFEIAIEEGATMVRLGTALFGPRGPV